MCRLLILVLPFRLLFYFYLVQFCVPTVGICTPSYIGYV